MNNTHHVCFSGELACSGANPCPLCQDVVNKHVLVFAMQKTLTVEQGKRFFQWYEEGWRLLRQHMMADPEVAARAFDTSRVRLDPPPSHPYGDGGYESAPHRSAQPIADVMSGYPQNPPYPPYQTHAYPPAASPAQPWPQPPGSPPVLTAPLRPEPPAAPPPAFPDPALAEPPQIMLMFPEDLGGPSLTRHAVEQGATVGLPTVPKPSAVASAKPSPVTSAKPSPSVTSTEVAADPVTAPVARTPAVPAAAVATTEPSSDAGASASLSAAVAPGARQATRSSLATPMTAEEVATLAAPFEDAGLTETPRSIPDGALNGAGRAPNGT